MKNIERSIYIVIIVILVGVLSCGITYMVMKDKNNDEIKEIDNKEEKEPITKDEDNKDPILKDGVKLLRTYQESDEIIQEYEIILNGNKKVLSLNFQYYDTGGGIHISSEFNDIIFYEAEPGYDEFLDYDYENNYENSGYVNSENINMIKTIKEVFNEQNFKLIKGKDTKSYLTVWTRNLDEANLYIFNDKLELLEDESFKDFSSINGNNSTFIIVATFWMSINAEGKEPWYTDKLEFCKDSASAENSCHINVKIDNTQIYYLVPNYDKELIEERVYEINNNKFEYKVVTTYKIKESLFYW